MDRRSKAARLIPPLLVAAATAIPAATAIDLLTHASVPTSLAALSPSTLGGTSLARTTPPGASTPAAAAGAGSGSGSTTFVGAAEQNRYGTVQATLVVTGNTITNVIITAPQDNPRSASINAYAVPILVSETLQAQSANINAVSGATYTSDSYLTSLQAALAAAHL